MKTIKILFALLLAMGPCMAADTNSGIGPKGGKLLENSAPRAEFFIEPDNRITITFYDANLKPVPLAGQTVMISAAPRSGKVNVELEKKDGALISKQPLPKRGFFDEYQITVQIKSSPESKPEIFQVRFDLDVCKKCKHPEYTCNCPR